MIVLNSNWSNWKYYIPFIGPYFAVRDWINYFFPTNVNMAVLGMPKCGKTTWIKFLNTLKAPEDVGETYVVDEVKKYRVKVAKHRYIEIQKGLDISGTDTLVYDTYPSLVKNSEVILFLFNSCKFYNNKEYRLDVVDRIAVISEHLKDAKMSKDFFIVPTYKDKLQSAGYECGDFKELLYEVLRSDESTKLFADPTFVKDIFSTNNKDELEKLKSVVFAKYLK